MTLKIAILSDMHAGDESRALDLSPGATADSAKDPNYVAEFLRFLNKTGLAADYLILPGDMSHSARPEEFEVASQAVLRIATQLGVSPERVLFVPGNHDVDWRVLREHGADATGFAHGQRYTALRAPQWDFEKYMQTATGALCEPPFVATWEFPDLVVFGINSSSVDGPDVDHYGLVDADALNALEAALEKVVHDDRPRVLLVHHHPMALPHPRPDLHDTSQMVNGPEVPNLGALHGNDQVNHGHRHVPILDVQTIDGILPIVIVSSGSFSVNLDTSYASLVQNQFHILEIDDRDEGYARGKLSNWAFVPGQSWQPSQEILGIDPSIALGTHVTLGRLVDSAKAVADELLTAKGHVEWRAMVEAMPELAYVPNTTGGAVIEALSQDLGLRSVGRVPDLVLLPGTERPT